MARRRQDTPEEAQRQREASSRADRFRLVRHRDGSAAGQPVPDGAG